MLSHAVSEGLLTQCANTSGQQGRLSAKAAAGKQQEPHLTYCNQAQAAFQATGEQQD